MEKIAIQLGTIINTKFGVERPVRLDANSKGGGDYATPVAMELAREVGKKPLEIAEEIVAHIPEDAGFTAGVSAPGFINIVVDGKDLVQELDANWSAKYGANESGAGKLALLDFPSPNVAKPFSVGHLRSGNQGWAAKQVLERNGWRVITDSHLGDSGTPFGIWAVGFLRFSSGEKLAEGGVYELGDVYIKTRKLLKEEAEQGKTELADEVQSWLKKLEANDPEAVALSDKFTAISLKHLHDIMARLKISTDYELGERFFLQSAKELVAKYVGEKTFTRNSDGSVICELFDAKNAATKKFENAPLLLEKSNGTVLYAATDLATATYREKEFAPDLVIFSVGAEQKFYFEQLFAMLQKLGFKAENIHMYFGTIDQVDESGLRAKMSSRKGVILMEELLDRAESKAREIAKANVSGDDVKKIALGAVKFSDFVADKKTNILFDWNTIFSLTGFSGTYVQYAGVRMKKILDKGADFERVDFADYDFKAEKPLAKLLLAYPELVRETAENLAFHKIANFAFQLASEFNKYYESTQILNAEPAEKSARLVFLAKAHQVLADALAILGIELPENM
jgi:arginyl-tRNA synthetase